MNLGIKLNRVRQFLRSDRTDVIGERLRYAEDQTEGIRILSEAFCKSLEKRLNTHGISEEKKYRKVPENQTAESLKDALQEISQNFSDEYLEKPLFRTIIEEAVGAEQLLGRTVLDYEDELERQVVSHFHHILKEEFPAVAKQKKALKQAGQDVNSLRAKVRSVSSTSVPANRLEGYKDELCEAELKLEQIKDSYACDLFSILSKQRELARLAAMYLELKADFLQKSLQKIHTVLPNIRTVYESSSCSPMYGVSLHEHLRITQQEISIPIQVCVKRMIEYGMYEEGLLRMAGSNNKVRRLKGLFDTDVITFDNPFDSGDYDIHVVADAFKSYLRELPEPLLTYVKHDELVEAVRVQDHEEKLRRLWQVINALPVHNYNNLRYVVKFLSLLASYSNENKMSSNNIAIVMAPNLIRSVDVGHASAIGNNMTYGSDYRVIVEKLIEYSDYFFKSDLDFGVHPKKPETKPTQVGLNTDVKKTETHRRTNSADFNLAGVLGRDESPKQPHRTKKKPAPLPPQGKTFDHDTLTELPSPTKNIESYRSKSPGSSALSPQPLPRLHHSNSVKRPTVGPPRPPEGKSSPTPSATHFDHVQNISSLSKLSSGANSSPNTPSKTHGLAPVKPPRPSPPNPTIEMRSDPPRNTVETQLSPPNISTDARHNPPNSIVDINRPSSPLKSVAGTGVSKNAPKSNTSCIGFENIEKEVDSGIIQDKNGKPESVEKNFDDLPQDKNFNSSTNVKVKSENTSENIATAKVVAATPQTSVQSPPSVSKNIEEFNKQELKENEENVEMRKRNEKVANDFRRSLECVLKIKPQSKHLVRNSYEERQSKEVAQTVAQVPVAQVVPVPTQRTTVEKGSKISSPNATNCVKEADVDTYQTKIASNNRDSEKLDPNKNINHLSNPKPTIPSKPSSIRSSIQASNGRVVPSRKHVQTSKQSDSDAKSIDSDDNLVSSSEELLNEESDFVEKM